MRMSNTINQSFISTQHERPPLAYQQQLKKPKLEPDSEVSSTHIANPPLAIFNRPGERFHTSSHLNLSRAQTYTDLSGEGVKVRSRLPASLIAGANIEAMSRLPLIQDPDDPSRPHPVLEQPVGINTKAKVNFCYTPVEAHRKAMKLMDHLLKSPGERQDYERTHFALACIKRGHLPQSLGADSDHATLGMRGIIAAKPLAAGSPLQYSAQYLTSAQWQEGVKALSEKIQRETGMNPSQADTEANRLLISYSWEGITYKGRKYELSAFGAGNAAAMINHDDQYANMGAVYMPTLDEKGKPGPRLMVYFALRDIAEGEQLLVNYGKLYQFHEPAEGTLEVDAAPVQTMAANMRQTLMMVKQEPDAKTSARTSNDQNPKQAQGFDAFLRKLKPHTLIAEIPNKNATALSLERYQDLKDHGHFFFSQPMSSLRNGVKDLEQHLIRCAKFNVPGALAYLRKHLPALAEKGYSLADVLKVTGHSGGQLTLDTLKGDIGKSLLAKGYTPADLVKIAINNGGRKVLETMDGDVGTRLRDNGYTKAQIIKAGAHDGGSKALAALDALNDGIFARLLSKGYKKESLINVVANCGSQNLLDALDGELATALSDKGYSQDQLIKIANHAGAKQVFEVLNSDLGTALLNRGYTKVQLAKVASNNGGKYALETLGGPVGSRLQASGCTKADLVRVASNNGGKLALEAIDGAVGKSLLKQGYTVADLVKIAGHDGAQLSLETLNGEVGRGLLMMGYTKDEVVGVAANDGGRRALETLNSETGRGLLALGYTRYQLSRVAGVHGARVTLEALNSDIGRGLLSQGYSQEDLVRITIRGGARPTLEALHGDLGKNLLAKGYSKQELVRIASTSSTKKALQSLNSHS